MNSDVDSTLDEIESSSSRTARKLNVQADSCRNYSTMHKLAGKLSGLQREDGRHAGLIPDLPKIAGCYGTCPNDNPWRDFSPVE